jgi:hypothetical protein
VLHEDALLEPCYFAVITHTMENEHMEPVETEADQQHDGESMEAYRRVQGTILTLTALAKGVATIDFFKEAYGVEQSLSKSNGLGWALFWISLISELDRFGQSLRDNLYVISKDKFYSNETPVSWQEQLLGQFAADTINNVSYVIYMYYVYKISTGWLVTFGAIQLVYIVLAGVAGAYFGIANKQRVE